MVLMKALFRHIRCRNQFDINKVCFHGTPANYTFFIEDKKGGYKDKRKQPSTTDLIRDGFKELKQEIKLWSHEVKERFEQDPLLVFRPGETDVIWRFGKQESIQNWNVTADSDHNEGYSTAALNLNKLGYGLFSGELSTKVPKDGRIKRAGYCNITTLPARKSFKREAYLDWTSYNMVVIKVRGDGRSYILNIGTKGYFDVVWDDIYHYVLYTRGGPYWQVSKIPFSKFFLSSRGRVQDNQFPLPQNKVSNFGISVGDKINGPYNLEIDYIGLEYDPNHHEDFAYEMYKTDKYIVAT